ncbi:MAG: class I SAM-dependent methyltransferase [Leptolyngbyaceae cyanobacterium SL_7_1]|nr:class I SAM-dependent methyltransferase [Leptolyngbyaceae cyanobacterium SL_7_1]
MLSDETATERVLPLYTDTQLNEAVAKLREMLKADEVTSAPDCIDQEIREKIQSFYPHWFQRIDYPNHCTTSTSNHRLAYFDEGGLNTLGKSLTSEEASILRPYPKWFCMKEVLPSVEGKSVLEIGSSNGFFSFRFAELGASSVTGVEISKPQYESAVWSANVLKHENVHFLNADILTDFSIPKHDIVFLSEVHNHFLFPFFGLLRVIDLANETVIFDTGALDVNEDWIRLDSSLEPKSNRLIYHSFMMSDGLIMNFLNLIGIPSSKVIRYKSPSNHYHILYIIDTRAIKARRNRLQYPAYLGETVKLTHLKQTQVDLRKAKNQIKKLNNQIKRLEAKLDQHVSMLAAIKTSKFWWLRSQWLRLKRGLNWRD